MAKYNPEKSESESEKNIYLQDMVFPEPEAKPKFELRFDPEIALTPEDWQGMTDSLEEKMRNHFWRTFADQAMSMKLLGATLDQLKLDDTAWQGMTDSLEKQRNNNWGDFAYQAMRMTILSAYKVEIPEGGRLKITMYPPEEKNIPKTPDLPTQLKF